MYNPPLRWGINKNMEIWNSKCAKWSKVRFKEKVKSELWPNYFHTISQLLAEKVTNSHQLSFLAGPVSGSGLSGFMSHLTAPVKVETSILSGVYVSHHGEVSAPLIKEGWGGSDFQISQFWLHPLLKGHSSFPIMCDIKYGAGLVDWPGDKPKAHHRCYNLIVQIPLYLSTVWNKLWLCRLCVTAPPL